MYQYAVFGRQFDKDGPFGWEFVGIFSAEDIDHAVEKAKDTVPQITKFWAGRGLFKENHATPSWA